MSSAPPSATPTPSQSPIPPVAAAIAAGYFEKPCSDDKPQSASCAVLVLTSKGRMAAALNITATAPTSSPAPSPAGYHPADLQHAYALDPTLGAGHLVAIVDAYSDPNLEADLGVYRQTFGLPACTSANGCLRIVDQNGGTAYPPADNAWSVEQSVDVDMVSAICPLCSIVVVEAATDFSSDLAAAENEAASLSPVAISNSWVTREQSNSATTASFQHPNIAITASTGDFGYEALSPSTFANVIAVGGTTLTPASNTRGFTETVWDGSGSGCSAFVAKPAWQHDIGCSMRTTTDVSFDADPNTGVAFYDSYPVPGEAPPLWQIGGGTSVGAPAIAAVFELSNKVVSDASGLYAAASSLNDVTTGSNGSCSSPYLCNGESGYDGPSGNGTPNTASAF
ncbi:MAG TPA: hypothetical protein VGD50_06090 [Candidatus Baltobacteraceae bacterium]